MSDDGKASRATLSHRTIGGFAAVDMLKIVTQMLQENGYDECAEHLQSTIGFSCESQNGGQFRAAVREARWSTAVQLADVIQFVGAKGSQKVTYLLEEQQVLQHLLDRDKVAALKLIRSRLTPASVFQERSRIVSSYVMRPLEAIPTSSRFKDTTSADLQQQLTTAVGAEPLALTERDHRELWLNYVLQPHIQPDDIMPPGRLVTLLQQAVTLQQQSCVYHNTQANAVSLLQDHHCTRDGVPRKVSHVLRKHQDEVWCVAFSKTGRYLATSSKDKRVIIWSSDSFQQLHELHGHNSGVSGLAWNYTDTALATIAEEDLFVSMWDVQAGVSTGQLDGHTRPPSALCFLPDNRLVTGAHDKTVVLMDATYEGHEHVWKDITPASMVATPDGQTLMVSCHERKIHFFSTSTYEEESLQLAQRISSLSVARDGKTVLASMLNSTIMAVDIASRVVVHTYEGHCHQRFALRACFGGLDDSFVISASEDNAIYLWSRQQRRPLEKLTAHTGQVNQVDWHPCNAEVFASVSDDHTVRIWSTVGHGAVTANEQGPASPRLAQAEHGTSSSEDDNDDNDDDNDEDSD